MVGTGTAGPRAIGAGTEDSQAVGAGTEDPQAVGAGMEDLRVVASWRKGTNRHGPWLSELTDACQAPANATS